MPTFYFVRHAKAGSRSHWEQDDRIRPLNKKGLKQAQEELGVRLAADDQQRALALLRQANARLDETTRLLQQGRTLDATATTLRCRSRYSTAKAGSIAV